MDDATAAQILAEAVAAFHPPVMFDPDDITTWDAEQLDELAVLAVNNRAGFEIDYIGVGQQDADHGANTAGEMI